MSTAVIDFSDTGVPTDEDTPAVTGPKLTCEVCGRELHYAGRGRKPKRCDEHRKSASKGTGGSGRKVAGNNAALASQASNALVQTNGLVALVLMWTGMPTTSEAITEAQEVFREQAYDALLTDPDLCKTILKAGTTSGKMSLLIAYGMLAGVVGPTAYMEIQMKREEKRAALEAQGDESGGR